MNKSKEQALKDHIRLLVKETNATYPSLWQKLVSERFLARLCRSKYKKHLIFKGGFLLSYYIDLGRETYDIDFLAKKISNKIPHLNDMVDHICKIDLNDAFYLKRMKTRILSHPHMSYTGARITLLAQINKTKTYIKLDIGFGDIIESINPFLTLTATKKFPLFERDIQPSCYPKEYIFAEKLEALANMGGDTSRIKDFHDLYSLVSLPNCIDATFANKVIMYVFKHRKTSVKLLPLYFDSTSIKTLQSMWDKHILTAKQKHLPSSISDVISAINHWVKCNTHIIQNKVSV